MRSSWRQRRREESERPLTAVVNYRLINGRIVEPLIPAERTHARGHARTHTRTHTRTHAHTHARTQHPDRRTSANLPRPPEVVSSISAGLCNTRFIQQSDLYNTEVYNTGLYNTGFVQHWIVMYNTGLKCTTLDCNAQHWFVTYNMDCNAQHGIVTHNLYNTGVCRRLRGDADRAIAIHYR